MPTISGHKCIHVIYILILITIEIVFITCRLQYWKEKLRYLTYIYKKTGRKSLIKKAFPNIFQATYHLGFFASFVSFLSLFRARPAQDGNSCDRAHRLRNYCLQDKRDMNLLMLSPGNVLCFDFIRN